MSDAFTPVPEDHFTFGLWTVGNPGRDPFGHEVRAPLDPVDSVKHLAERGRLRRQLPRRRPRARRLVSRPSATRSSRGSRARSTRPGCGCRWRRATCSRSRCSATARSPPTTRRCVASRWPRRSTRSTSASSSAPSVFVMWGGREGCEVDAAKDSRAALDRYAEAVNLVCEYVRDSGYDAAVRARAQAQRAARRHPAADGRAHARVHRRAGVIRRWWA